MLSGHLGEIGYMLNVVSEGIIPIVDQFGLTGTLTQKLSFRNLNVLLLGMIALTYILLFFDMIRKPKNNLLSIGVLFGAPLVYALAKVLLVDVFDQSEWWTFLIFPAVFGLSGWLMREQKSKTGGEEDSVTGLILGALTTILLIG